MVHIRQFHYAAATRHFSAEMSEVDGFVQVWQDSADEGLVVHNPDTGRSVTFVVTEEHTDAEGDVTHWDLASVTGTRQDGRFTMTVFND